MSYLPSALDCRLSSGGSCTAAVPDFLTPVMTVCAVFELTLALIAVAERRRTTAPECSGRSGHSGKRGT
ncbi:hypothetical protein ABTZ58_17530 [Streptomyces sp. NPDC094143]|uniref:hypothetical protein n=1 Tax=Streptomyces sp. NPDC094143 TaxID=3155310 RepID=UPI003328C64E